MVVTVRALGGTSTELPPLSAALGGLRTFRDRDLAEALSGCAGGNRNPGWLHGHSEIRVTAGLDTHLQKQMAAKAATVMDAVLNGSGVRQYDLAALSSTRFTVCRRSDYGAACSE